MGAKALTAACACSLPETTALFHHATPVLPRLWALLLCAACGLALGVQAAETPRVLMVASYHAGMPWSDAQIAGVQSQLGALPVPVTMQLDFLDTKHVQPDARYYQEFERLLLVKYGTAPPAALVAADDDALDFLLRLRQHNFPDVPILFSGVSGSRRTALEQEAHVGGVFDDLDLEQCLRTMLTLLPQTHRVVVVHDQSRTSLAQVQTLREALRQRKDLQVEYLSGLPVNAMQARLRQLGSYDLVFALAFNRDAQDRMLTHEEAADLWAQASGAPVVVTREVAMRPGILGGFLVSGFAQGQTAGRLVGQVLQGQAPATLPLMAGISQATLDYQQMQHWGIDEDTLPPQVSVLNRPVSAIDGLRPHRVWLLALFGSLLVIIGLLLYGMRLRRTAERELRRSAQNYRALFDNSPDAIVVRDIDTCRMVDANPRFRDLFGYQNHEIAGIDVGALSAGGESYGAAQVRQWEAGVARPGAQVFEWQSRRKDGSVFWSENSVTRYESADGQRTVISIRDISDRKRAESMAREFEHRVQQIYQNLPVAVFTIDAAHIITSWNPQMERLTRVPASQVLGTTDTWRGAYPEPRPCLIDMIVDGASDEALARLYPGKLRTSKLVPGALEGEDFFPFAGGAGGMWIRFCAAPMRDNASQVVGAIETLMDVTELKAAQKKLESLNQELETRVTTRTQDLERAMGQLVQSEKLAALGSLVAGIAHELNTPIGNVMAVSSTLTTEVGDFSQRLLSGTARRSEVTEGAARLREASALIERNALKAAQLIRDFKEIAVDQSSTRRRQFLLRDLVQDVLSTSQPLFKHVQHQVVVDMDGALALDSYPGPLEQILTNFLANSLNHAFGGMPQGEIRIAARADGAFAVLDYADNGCGIAPENLPHIFEPFYTTKLGQGGSGLGLYIAYNLVQSVLGGSIAVDSPPGQGARFTLRLPLVAPHYVAPVG